MEENPYQTPETPPAKGRQRYWKGQRFSLKRIVASLVIVFAFFLAVALVDLLIYQAMR